jgi:hypothetical protein
MQLRSSALGAVSAPPPIEVGEAARKDVLVSRASLIASQILYGFVKSGQRESYLKAQLRRFGAAAWPTFRRERAKLMRDRNPNQATYDAMRVVIVNHLARDLVQRMDAASARGGLGMNDDERAVACGVTGGLTLVGGIIGSIYGGQAGGAAASTGGSIGAAAFDCSKNERESAERVANANTQAAQATAAAAVAAAQAAERTAQIQAESREKQTKLLLFGGGGIVLTVALAFIILKA